MGEHLRSLILTVRRGPVIYPYLFAVFPVLFIWAHSIGELTPSLEPLEILVPLALSTVFTVVVLVSGSFILKDTRKAGLLVLLFLVSFYLYGHVYTSLQNAGIGDSSEQWLFPLAWATAYLSVGILTLRIRADLRRLTNSLNVTAGLLVIISLVNIGTYTLGSWTTFQANGDKEIGAFQVNVTDTSKLPDIYYIVPDAYASSQILGDFGYDNSEFTDYLTRKGFFVADDSHSNYMYTDLSLASSLNMRYLTDIEGGFPGDTEFSFLYYNLKNNGQVVSTLRSLGYTFINTRGKWLVREDDNRLSVNCAGGSSTRLQSDEFTGALLRTTALYPVLRIFNVVERQIWKQRLCEFSLIVDVKDIEGPKFVYSHLTLPHSPFVFDRNGERDPESLSTINFQDRPEEYADQVAFVDKQLKEVVNGLLSGKRNSPIIIIQADHGARVGGGNSEAELPRTRFGIINAYHLPDGGNDILYESISPVNTFRVIFNRYFGADYELLEDRSYLTDPPFASSMHVDVTDLINK